MTRYHKDATIDSPSATTSISHHVNLNFEIWTSNLCVLDRQNDKDQSKQETDKVNRPWSENWNGILQDSVHGCDHEVGSDYTSNVRL